MTTTFNVREKKRWKKMEREREREECRKQFTKLCECEIEVAKQISEELAVIWTQGKAEG